MWIVAHYFDLETETKWENKCIADGELKGRNVKEHCLGFLRQLIEEEDAVEEVWHVRWKVITWGSLDKWEKKDAV